MGENGRVKRAQAVVDHAALTHNLGVVAKTVAPADLMLVVKADAYGHGAVSVARTARAHGIGWLGVALPSEALELRRAGDTGRMLAWLYPPQDDDVADCVAADVDLSVSSLSMLDQVRAAAKDAGRRARIQLKVDTGLSRNGCPIGDWPELVAAAAKAQAGGDVEVVGLWSHFANGDLPEHPSVAGQLAVFDEADGIAAAHGIEPQLRHMSNSPAGFLIPAARFDLVRAGISAYGVSPTAPGFTAARGLRAVMTLEARVVIVKTIPPGQSVSYGSTWTATRPTRLALVPVGYADGIPRIARGAHVLVGGRQQPVVGRVAMDQFVVALDDDVHVREGDRVVVFGDASTGAPTADDWGIASASIGYEVVTRIGPRVPRVHVEGGHG